MTNCYERAKEIIRKYRKQLDNIVEILLEKETIEGEELRKILSEEFEKVVE